MGSTGKNNAFSDVDSRTTPISDEDKEIVGGHALSVRYFQSSDSFDINGALRNAAEFDMSIEEALKSYGWLSATKISDMLKVINTMDKNMHPLDNDINVVRMADNNYLTSLLKNVNLPQDIKNRLDTVAFGMGTFKDSDVDALRDMITGARVIEGGYMSTTYNTSLSDAAFDFRRIKLNILATKGTHALFSPTGKESEMVLSRTTGYTIVGVRLSEDKKKLILDVRT